MKGVYNYLLLELLSHTENVIAHAKIVALVQEPVRAERYPKRCL